MKKLADSALNSNLILLIPLVDVDELAESVNFKFQSDSINTRVFCILCIKKAL